MIFIMIVLIGDAESVCDMKECSDSYSTVVTGLIMRSRRCKDYKNHFAHILILEMHSNLAVECPSRLLQREVVVELLIGEVATFQ